MSKTALITGITGQDGAYLAEFLLSKGYKVYGGYRRLSSPNFWRLEELAVKDKINLKVYKEYHIEKTLDQKKEEIKNYAKLHNLEFDGKFLIAYRNHDNYRGLFNKTIIYNEINKKYKDWHCDNNSNHDNSFGLGIWPKGNTKIKVDLEDWGCAVNGDTEGKARVSAFTLLENN